jgi:hypothetical protein
MFGYSSIIGMIESYKKREAWIKTLPEQKQEKIRSQDAQEARENLAHKRALEVAEAGRARNFWGK